MTDEHEVTTSRLQRLLGWLIHLFTASGACVGVFALFAIYEGETMAALWLMFVAIFIDAVDGTMARKVRVKEVVPEVDGSLLDNIVDFVNYTIVPSFFLLTTSMLPPYWRYACVVAIIFASAYQFTQVEAKTDDHFFRGFPSFWNIAVFYLFVWQMSPVANLIVCMVCVVLSFVPIKYVYPSRLDYLTDKQWQKVGLGFATVLWAAATSGLLWVYPSTNHFLVGVSISYVFLYIGISLYRTFKPLMSLSLESE